MELLVVGAGTMGEWVARTVDAEVAFADVDPEAAEDAASAVGGRAVPLDGEERFDAVAIAVPMSASADAIEAQAPRATEAIFDVTGEMKTPIEAMAEHAPDLERASIHPLFAPANGPGSVAVVIEESGPTIDPILADVARAGNTIVETTPAEHDEAMETVQARAHAAIIAYGLSRESVPEGFETPVSSKLDDLLDQVTSGDPGVYAEIQQRFAGAEDVADAAAELAGADAETIRELVVAARPETDQADGDDA